jgi:opacity protein-like surface antigen
LKSKLLVSVLALVTAAMLPVAATGQLTPDRAPRADADRTYKYLFYGGAEYTSLNQVNKSRYGLIGANLEVSREFGRFFAITADGAFYSTAVGSGNPGKPTVDQVLFGPELHGVIFDRWSVFVRALIGGEHSGGESQTPNISFAGGAGGGVEYALTSRLVLRLSGDDIAAAFSPINNTPALGYSPHTTRNSRAGFGIGYRF